MKILNTPESLEMARREADILRQLKHEGIIELKESFDWEGAFVLITEMATHGDLKVQKLQT